ncbi:MAG: isomerase [Magnetovibrio sp.]|nr:isomerase [Magnetovibrio sp.]
MKINSLEIFIVGNPTPKFGGRYFIFVKLITNDGIEGIGEIYASTFSPKVVAKMIEDIFDRHVQGWNPYNIELLWRIIYGRGYTLRPDLSLVGVLSGIEMACWDIIGKASNRPIYDLLGGRVREKLRTYTYLYPETDELDSSSTKDVYWDADIAAERAAEYVAQGFTAIKFDPAGPYTIFDGRQPHLEDFTRCEEFAVKIRGAVGDKADLLFGTHGQFTPSGAIRLAKLLETVNPLWLEEPTPPEMPEELARVAQATSIPIATGERLATKYEFARVLFLNAAAILQPALGRVGGILEAKKIASMAEAKYAQIAPHLYCGPIEGAANIQLAACTPNFIMLEGIQTWGGFHAEILKKPILWEDGYIVLSTEPGLGVELNEEVARAHPYYDDLLHLEMAEEEWLP